MKFILLVFFILGCVVLEKMFFQGATPVLGMFVFCLAVVFSFSVGVKSSSWFGVSVWLVFLSGLLVIFLFFCAFFNSSSRGVGFGSVGIFVGGLGGGWMYGLESMWVRMEPLVIYDSFSSILFLWGAVMLLLVMVAVMKVSSCFGGGSLREN